MCRAGQGIKPDVMLLNVGLWHMLHVDSHEAFGRDLDELGSAVRTLKRPSGVTNEDEARSTYIVILGAELSA